MPRRVSIECCRRRDLHDRNNSLRSKDIQVYNHAPENAMKSEAFYKARNDLSELGRLNELLSRFCRENRLPEDVAMEIGLALEEVFVNVVRYAYEDSAEHEILVSVAAENGEAVLAVEDDGIAFNPLEVPPVDTSLAIEDRPVGGLGIHLVRSVMNEVNYARKNGRNRLEMSKRFLPR